LNNLVAEWQQRYDNTDKGEWTKKMIPDLGKRYVLPLVLDHYTSQMLISHGDFNAQLYRFKLVNSLNCSCSLGGAETVAHVLLWCKRTQPYRQKLIRTLHEAEESWPPPNDAFMNSRKAYEGLRKFAESSLKQRDDRLTDNKVKDQYRTKQVRTLPHLAKGNWPRLGMTRVSTHGVSGTSDGSRSSTS